MTFLKIVIIAFILLETSNVLALYFAPGSKYANAVGVFTAWEKSKQYPEIHDFVKYLVYWVAGAKLIFLLLLAMIVIYADLNTQRLSVLVLIITTASFYWRLFPLIKKAAGGTCGILQRGRTSDAGDGKRPDGPPEASSS